MSGPVKKLVRLEGAQAEASDPRELVWLSASAGTGKTHVLTARVIRLLLADNDPAAILCLTFTKAGAAEMADRIHARLASWVRMKSALLAEELIALGEDFSPTAVARARTLFARVLEATGGGLRIQTIHAFCQMLLAAFPSEAGLVPGFRPLEEREEQALGYAALSTMLVEAEGGGDLPLIADVQALSRRLGEEAAERFLRTCARAGEAMEKLGAAQGIEAKLRRALDVPSGNVEEALANACDDGNFDSAGLSRIAAANAAWGTQTGLADADRIADWLAADPVHRAEALAGLVTIFHTAKREPRKYSAKLIAADPTYAHLAVQLGEQCQALLVLRTKAAFAAALGAGLRAGQAYARAYSDAKRAAGAVDFDDLIGHTVRLLETDGMGDWVRYKLDQRTDHILVDEAQDTNARQWSIVAALAGEFFAGEGARGRTRRTIFTVGDFKQAIFGFQGTNPLEFEAARQAFTLRAQAAADADLDGRLTPFRTLSLDRSFRSTPPVLALVDRLIDHLTPGAFGIEHAIPPHEAARAGPGRVILWSPVSIDSEQAADAEAPGEEGWLDNATRLFSDRLARQVATWLADPPWVASQGRPLRPEDVMILVRKRGDLASLIVARLHAHAVPVAGIDRLRLDQPLAVKDLLAAARFAIQPEDDLTLANLLVSPLFGLSQDSLFELAYGRDDASLLSRVRDVMPELAGQLSIILNAADQVTPYRFFEEILSGRLDGRRKMLRRLGEEARDPIEELLNASLLFELNGAPSLQPFLDWFDRGEVQIKRDPSAPLGAVRVMTVHGAKGLQAPLVVLADATGDPDRSVGGGLDWSIEEGMPAVPSFRPRAEERFPPLDGLLDAAAKRDMEEHWRLLYVAATRAEEMLAIGGALGPAARGVVPPNSWYMALSAAMNGLETEALPDPLWREVRVHAGGEGKDGKLRLRSPVPEAEAPAWLREPAPQESRPPRPLAPSAIGIDDVAHPPPTPVMRDAAERGRLLHSLFERLPALALDVRHAAAMRWLEHAAGVDDAGRRHALADDACAIIADPRYSAIFAPNALAEVPIAAVVDGRVIAGTVDRLLVTNQHVMIIDFKTGRRVPGTIDQVSSHHLDQMAAYAAALGVIFPGRAIEAALLYTAGPSLIPLDAAMLAARKPRLSLTEQDLTDGG